MILPPDIKINLRTGYTGIILASSRLSMIPVDTGLIIKDKT